MLPRPADPLIVAVDVADLREAQRLAALLSEDVAMLKVGLELFTAAGPEAVLRLQESAPVFLDLKLHDIPTTVARAAASAGRLGVSMLTVHASGGPEMVAAAVEGASTGAHEGEHAAPSVIAITVLSSLAVASQEEAVQLAMEKLVVPELSHMVGQVRRQTATG